MHSEVVSFFLIPATSSVHHWPSITINSHIIQILCFWGFSESHFYLRQAWPEVVIESSLTFVQIRWVSMSFPGLQTYRSDPLAAVPWHNRLSKTQLAWRCLCHWFLDTRSAILLTEIWPNLAWGTWPLQRLCCWCCLLAAGDWPRSACQSSSLCEYKHKYLFTIHILGFGELASTFSALTKLA